MNGTSVVSDVKERPAIFSGPEVRAILEGRKTQMRGVVKLPDAEIHGTPYAIEQDGVGDWIAWYGVDSGEDKVAFTKKAYPDGGGFKCPYGKPGDRLWVKHEFWRGGRHSNDQVWDEYTGTVRWEDGSVTTNVSLALDDKGNHALLKRKSPIYMPRWASRILLEITSLRVERLQDIGEADALAEGIDSACGPLTRCETCASVIFAKTWDSIHGKKHPWNSNPWVWVIEFSRRLR